ncbi:hypothetical protein [uncultured Desulfosarcina sp.]|uniref:hypothetical protein n=1 Tax=uncultured Desulfosarcina sp. TaxID=218289 RepID=UPI0029C919D4|nr:hypothetical protein [uncultured Desulfosarcina sp.]
MNPFGYVQILFIRFNQQQAIGIADKLFAGNQSFEFLSEVVTVQVLGFLDEFGRATRLKNSAITFTAVAGKIAGILAGCIHGSLQLFA